MNQLKNEKLTKFIIIGSIANFLQFRTWFFTSIKFNETIPIKYESWLLK